MDRFDLERELETRARTGETDFCANRVTEIMRSLPKGPFHLVLDLDFTNPPEAIGKHFDAFLETQAFAPAAVYTETNGFCINPDRWFFDVFAYKAYGGHDDYDWLSAWDSGRFPDMTLTGMERLQHVYASDAFHDRALGKACDLCTLLVKIRFQDLIRRSIHWMRRLSVPVLATSHDSDFIAEFRK